MKIKDLIGELNKYDPEKQVCFLWDSGYSDVEEIVPSTVAGFEGCPEVNVSSHDSLGRRYDEREK